MNTRKQRLVMKLMDRGSFKSRPCLLASALSVPAYESYRNQGYTIRNAIKAARKIARAVSKYSDREGAAKQYKGALDILGPERFSKFIRSELDEIAHPTSTAGIRMRSCRYLPNYQKEIYSGRTAEDFPEDNDRSDELLGGDNQRAYLDGMSRQ